MYFFTKSLFQQKNLLWSCRHYTHLALLTKKSTSRTWMKSRRKTKTKTQTLRLTRSDNNGRSCYHTASRSANSSCRPEACIISLLTILPLWSTSQCQESHVMLQIPVQARLRAMVKRDGRVIASKDFPKDEVVWQDFETFIQVSNCKGA